jgi:hypothetical protein
MLPDDRVAKLQVPMTLLWHPGFIARWGIGLAALLFSITIVLMAASGRRIEARNIG